MEEYMESELSGIFRVKLVTKNIVRGSLGTQFMHMRVKPKWQTKRCTEMKELFICIYSNYRRPVQRKIQRNNLLGILRVAK